MRVVLVGNSGSGKSSLAQALAAHLGVPRLDLDTVAWEPGQVAVARPPALAEADVRAFCEAPGWVVEGCYGALVRAALGARPWLLLVDPGVEVCLHHARLRPWEPHKYPSPEAQDAMLPFLLDWIRAYETRDDDLSRVAHEALYAAYDGPKRRLVRAVDLAATDLMHVVFGAR